MVADDHHDHGGVGNVSMRIETPTAGDASAIGVAHDHLVCAEELLAWKLMVLWWLWV